MKRQPFLVLALALMLAWLPLGSVGSETSDNGVEPLDREGALAEIKASEGFTLVDLYAPW